MFGRYCLPTQGKDISHVSGFISEREFPTAGSLRVALKNGQWDFLPVPGKLKRALALVLEEARPVPEWEKRGASKIPQFDEAHTTSLRDASSARVGRGRARARDQSPRGARSSGTFAAAEMSIVRSNASGATLKSFASTDMCTVRCSRRALTAGARSETSRSASAGAPTMTQRSAHAALSRFAARLVCTCASPGTSL